MKTFKLFLGLFLIAVVCGSIYSQDPQNSVGPAPYVYRLAPENPMFDAQVGTRAFTQISSTPTFQFGKSFMESCTITNIGAPFSIGFPGGLVYRNGVIYTYNQTSPFQMYSIDTVTGAHSLVFNLAGVPQANLTGMVWDGTTMYALSTSITQSQIMTVSMITGSCTPIGTASAVCPGGITLLGLPGISGGLFALDIIGDNLYRVNKTTGVFTLQGALGQDINFGQDGSVDPRDSTAYVACYTTAGPELRKINLSTGALGPILCTYTAQATGLACVPPVIPVGPSINFCKTGINVPINDHSTARDSVNVILGSGCSILDVNVRIDAVTHTWDSDLTFYLQRGTVGALIINKVGGSGDNFTNTVLDDQASIPIASGVAPFIGSFIPSNPLASFNGPFVNGYWRLVITDTAPGDTGALTAWCLAIQYNCPTGGIQTIEIPNYYSLSQNYPNPFNPVTSIKFTLPQGDNVKLVIFDILGREVKTLVNDYRNAGVYEVSFDASSLSSGAYFYRLEAGDYSATKKMLIIK